jgi:hypothetical protein
VSGEEPALILEVHVPFFILEIFQEKARVNGEGNYAPVGVRDYGEGETDEYFEKNFVKAGAFLRRDPRFPYVPQVVFPLYRLGDKDLQGNMGEKMWSVQKRIVDELCDEKQFLEKRSIAKWRDLETIKYPSANLENFKNFLRRSFQATTKELQDFIKPLEEWVKQVHGKPKLHSKQMIGSMPTSQAVRRLEDFSHNLETDFRSDATHEEHLGWVLRNPNSPGQVLRGIGSKVNTASASAESALVAILEKPGQYVGTQKTLRYKEVGRGAYTEKGKALTSKEEKKLKHALKDLGL